MAKKKTKGNLKLLSTYLKEPSYKGRTNIKSYEFKKIALEKEQEKQEKKYAEQEAKISLGQMPSKTRAEFESLIQRDKTKRQKLPPLRMNPMSQEQELLGSILGGGDKVLFNNPESESMPKLNGALMRNRFTDEDETAETFGFGINKSRSGLF